MPPEGPVPASLNLGRLGRKKWKATSVFSRAEGERRATTQALLGAGTEFRNSLYRSGLSCTTAYRPASQLTSLPRYPPRSQQLQLFPDEATGTKSRRGSCA